MALTVLSVAYPFAPVSPDTAGGAEQVLLTLDRALCRAGHRSIVLACDGSKVNGQLVSAPRPSALDPQSVREGRQRHGEILHRILNRWQIDVVHMHGVDFDSYLPPPGVPVLVTLHLPIPWYSQVALHPTRPATWLHCVSASQHRTAGPDIALLPPIENGVDLDEFSGRHARRGFALMLARICPEKGVHLAIDAAKQADVPLLIGGALFPYPVHQDYFNAEVRPRLDARRRWLGPLPPMRRRRLLAAAHCLLVPSLVPETSSLVAREAAAAGTPVIAFANGALSDTVEHGHTGFLVEDADGMTAAIQQTDRIERDVCRAVARRRFSADRMAAAYLRRYGELARHPVQGAA